MNISFPAPKVPHVLTIDVNDKCASNCTHCLFRGIESSSLGVASRRLIDVIDLASSFKVPLLCIPAREPFLNTRVGRRTIVLLSHAMKKRFREVRCTSSARFLPRAVKMLDEADVTVDALDVSIDGIGVLHNKVRNNSEWSAIDAYFRGTYTDTVANELGVCVTVERQNLLAVSDILDFASKRADSAFVVPVSLWKGGPEIGINADQFVALLATLEQISQTKLPVQVDLLPMSVSGMERLYCSDFICSVFYDSNQIPMLETLSMTTKMSDLLFPLGLAAYVCTNGDVAVTYHPVNYACVGNILQEPFEQILSEWPQRVAEVATEIAVRKPLALFLMRTLIEKTPVGLRNEQMQKMYNFVCGHT